MQVIGGLGGMDKTQVALEYVEQHREHYRGKIRWIMAETEITLDQSFREFADDLGIDTEKVPLTEVVDKVYQRLSQQDQVGKSRGVSETESEENLKTDKVLLVFDNVDSYERIKDYLPNSHSNNRSSKANSNDQVQHVLITTRNIREWELKATQGGLAGNNLHVIRLEPFSEADALALIGKFVPGASLDDAKLLASTFGNIPLALTQALSFIQINEIEIQTYLEEYRALRQKELKTDQFSSILESDGNHALDIYTTLSLNVESLSSLPLGDQAIQLLNLCSYLYADKIPEKLFSELFTNKIEASKVLSILKGYSLITVKQLEDGDKYIYIHRLLQDVLKMKTHETRAEYLLEASKLVHKSMNYGQNQVKEILTIAKPLLPHAEELIMHCSKNQLASNELKTLLGDLYSDCGRVFDTSAEFSRALSSYQESLSIGKEIYGSRHTDVASSLNNIGFLYDTLGRHEEALKYYEESLSIYKEIYGSRHTDVATSLNNIGSLYYTLGRHEEALDFCKEALSIRREFFPETHSSVQNSLSWVNGIAEELTQNKDKIGSVDVVQAQTKDVILADDNDSTSIKRESLHVENEKHKQPLLQSQQSDESTEQCCCIVSMVSHIKYDNKILNRDELQSAALKEGGVLWLNDLIDLGQDQELSHALIGASQEYGPKHVIEILFGSSVIGDNSGVTVRNTEDAITSSHIPEQDDTINLVGES